MLGIFNIFQKLKEKIKKTDIWQLIKDKRGTMGFFIVFVVVAVLMTILFAFGIPLLISINTEFYKAGEELINESLTEINQIQDQTIKDELNKALTDAKTATSNNIGILSWFYQYSWVFVVIVVALVIFMLARTTVETQIR